MISRRIFSQEIFLSQRRQLLQCLLSDNRLHMLGKVRIQSRCKPPDIRVFRENVADLVELFGSTVRLTENQVVAAVLRIFVQGIRTIVDRAEYSGYVDHVIQCTENIKTGELLQIFIIEELRSCGLFLGGFLCRSRAAALTGRMLFRLRNAADQPEYIVGTLRSYPSDAGKVVRKPVHRSPERSVQNGCRALPDRLPL